MKNFYGAQYILIGLSVISFSLSGMKTDDSQLTEIKQYDQIIVFKPQGGFFEVTQENKPLFEKYFQTYGIILNNPITKVICVESSKQTNKKNVEIQRNTQKYIQETPLLLPLDLFTQGKNFEININNKIIQFRANGAKQEASFRAHAMLLEQQIKSTNNKQTSPAQYAQDFQQQLNQNSIPTLKFLAQLSQEQNIKPNDEVLYQTSAQEQKKQTLPQSAIGQLLETLINQSYAKQLEMIDGINESQHQELLTLFLANNKLDAMLSNKYNDLKQSAGLGNTLETDDVLDNAVASLRAPSLTLKDALCIYSILTKESISSSTAVDTLSLSVKTIIDTCHTFEKVIEYKTEQETIAEESVKKISLTKEIANLCGTIKIMINDFGNDEQQQNNINYPIPTCIEPYIMEQLCGLLDRCLLINCDGLDEITVADATKTLQGEIKKSDLEILTQLLNAAHYLDVAKEVKENDKVKPIILQSLLQLAFLDKLIPEPYENRNKIISMLDPDLTTDCLKIILEKHGQKLQNLLIEQYNQLKEKAGITTYDTDPMLETAIMWKENNIPCTNRSLSQLYFINDILHNNAYGISIIDDNVSTPVKIILDACNYFKEEITKAGEGKRLRDKHARQLAAEQKEQKAAAIIAKENWDNSIRGRISNSFASFIAYTKQNPRFVAGTTAYVAFIAGYIYYFRTQFANMGAQWSNSLMEILYRQAH